MAMYSVQGHKGRRSQPATAHKGSPTTGSQLSRQALGPKRRSHCKARCSAALAAEPDVDRYREALADSVEESDRVLVMLNTLMDISEAESGAMPLRREALDVRECAERAVELYRDVADAMQRLHREFFS